MNRSLFQTQGLQITEIVDTRLMQIDLPGAFLWMIEKKKKNKQTKKKRPKVVLFTNMSFKFLARTLISSINK